MGTVAAVLVGACASGGGEPRVRTSVQLEPPAPAASAEAALPDLPVAQVEGVDAGSRRVSVDAADEDIRLVIEALAESLGMGYQIHPAVAGRVDTKLKGVTLEQALESIVSTQGFSYSLEGNVLRVGPTRFGSEIFTLDYIAVSRFGSGSTVIQRRFGGSGGVSTAGGIVSTAGGGGGGGGGSISTVEVTDLWNEIRVALEALIFEVAGAGAAAGTATSAVATPGVPGVAGAGPGVAGGFGGGGGAGAYSRVGPDGRRLIINPMAGTILVSAPGDKLAEVGAFLRTIEGSVQRQVLIEARFVEVVLNRDYEFGIDWDVVEEVGGAEVSGGTPGVTGGGVQLTLSSGGGQQINVVLNALDQQGEVRVLSSPRISTLNNQRAVFNVGTDEVFFSVTRQPVIGPNGATILSTAIEPQQIAVGIVLDVLPQISTDNVITMNVRPAVTDVIRVEEVRLEDGTQAQAPVIDRRESDSVVRVRDGETIIIGGLMRTRMERREGGVPLLKDIPLLGRLFRTVTEREEKRELVIFLTPTIIAGQPQIGG